MTTKHNVERSLTLRAQALALLQEASSLDGLRPFVASHRHAYGDTTYMLWASRTPAQEDLSAILDAEFEPEKGECIVIEENLSLEAVAGTDPACRVPQPPADNLDATDDKIELALRDVLRWVTAGTEYPDAQWAATQRYGVNADALQAAYDEHCAAQAERRHN